MTTATGPERATTSNRADLDALHRLAKGDREVLAWLYDRHGRAVYSLALHIMTRPHDAEDVAQDVFRQVWRQACRFDGASGSVVAWLLMITRSRALDRLRANRDLLAGGVEPYAALPQVEVAVTPAGGGGQTLG